MNSWGDAYLVVGLLLPEVFCRVNLWACCSCSILFSFCCDSRSSIICTFDEARRKGSCFFDSTYLSCFKNSVAIDYATGRNKDKTQHFFHLTRTQSRLVLLCSIVVFVFSDLDHTAHTLQKRINSLIFSRALAKTSKSDGLRYSSKIIISLPSKYE